MSDPLLTQTKQIVINIFNYLEEQKKINYGLEYNQNITDIDKYIAEITGLSESSIKRIICERKDIQRQTSFHKKTIVLDESDLSLIKDIVNGFNEKANKLPSLQNLQSVLSDENILDCGIKDISTLLHNLGFDYKKYESSNVEIEYGKDEHSPCRAVLQECDLSCQEESSLDSF